MYINRTNYQNPAVYKKPKNKTLKVIVFIFLALLLSVGSWIGVTAYKSVKKITAFSSGNNSIFDFLGDSDQQIIKGQKDGRTNILLLGYGGKNHPGGMLSDTMIVLSLDWETKKVAMISIPRDLWVPIPNYGSAKINEAYYSGENNAKVSGGGGKVASDTVSKVLGIPIHYFLSIDFSGFKKMVDTVGGVDIYVEKDLVDPFYPANNMIDYAPFKITKGWHHMDGETALKYVRSRKTTSDFDRSRRQEQVISAVKEKTLTLNILANPKKITDLLNVMGDHIRTNMSIGEIRSLWDNIKSFDTQNLINHVFDTNAGGPLISSSDERGYYIYPKKGINDFSELQAIAKNIFSQKDASENESEKVNGVSTKKDLKIGILNGSGETGAANTLSRELKNEGYDIVQVGDASRYYDSTIIYNCSGNSATTISNSLAKRIGGEVKDKTSCDLLDIQIILGED